MSDCVFCKIIAGSIPANKVYEDDAVIAFLDIAPIAHGHTLVVSKAHYPNLLATPAPVLLSVISAVQKIAPALAAATGAPDFNLGVNTGPAAGQVVMHTHVHLIPRRANDGLKSWPDGTYGPAEAAALASKIAAVVQ